MHDESTEGVSDPLSDAELLDRDYYWIERLIVARRRAERIGRPLSVRSDPRSGPVEPYVYVLEGDGREGEPVTYSVLEEVERRLNALELSQRTEEDR